MPIVIQSVSLDKYLLWLSSQLDSESSSNSPPQLWPLTIFSIIPTFLLNQNIKDKLPRNYPKSEEKIQSYKTVFSLLNSNFKKWFVGFSDAESCFFIEYKKSRNNINLAFIIGMHIDDLPLLIYIQKTLGCGKIFINSKKTSCTFIVREFSAINYILIPIFQEFPLQSKKFLDYLDFLTVAEMIHKKEHLTGTGIHKILNIKKLMNTGRVNYSLPSNFKFNITWDWLLGFIEGDGSFYIKEFSPVFSIDLIFSDQSLLLAIKDFLNVGSVIIKNIPKSRLGTNEQPRASFKIYSIDFFYSYFVPKFDSLTFLSKKKLDYLDWSIIVKLKYLGYHTLPEGKELIINLKSRMNNNRLSTNLQNSLIIDENQIAKVFSLPSPYSIIDGKLSKK